MDEFIKLLDEHLDYVSHEIVGDTLIIRVSSNRPEAICPYCGTPSGKVHSTYEKSFQDLPVMGMKSRIIIDNRKLFCHNPECSNKTFAETFDFLQHKGKKTERLLDKIVDISLGVSSVAAADILRDGIADVGKSTICNLLKKNTPLPDKESITKVCIDDFAFRKRYTYGTVMVDIDTHRIVDVLESREVDDVAEWLKTYPNLDTVSRDGSVSYNSAVKKANADIVQVSDRFHLVKGLTDAAKKHITRIVAANIGIPSSESHYEGKQTNVYWEKPSEADFPTREHNESREKKVKLVERVRELTRQGNKRTEISAELGISPSTVKRYQSPDFNPVNARYNTTRDSKLKPYTGAIKKMLGEGHTFKEIEEAIRKDGYNGAASTIRMYTTRERKLIKEAQEGMDGPVEKIERKWLVKLLYKPPGAVKGLSQEALDQVIEKYPVIGSIYDIVGSFKQTLFGKKPEELEEWLKEAEGLNIEAIQSFVNGIRQDLAAVKKAIELDYNNGLAEGSVNKIKVIKRIMYGRNNFQLLKGKVLRLELKRRIN